MAMLGEDLVLLTVQQGGGRLPTPNVTGVGLMGAELVRLAAIAQGTGEVDLAQAAFGGLAHAIGLAGKLYPGRDGRAARKRLEIVADGDVTAQPAGHAAHHAVHAASHAAVSAAVHSATHAAVSAAHSSGGGHGGGGHH